MVNIFELFEHEVACDMAYVESAIATAKYEMLSDPEVFMEAGASGNIFQRLIAKVKEIVEKAINTIRQFFSSKQVESNIKKAEEVAKANPGLLKKKVKVKDYEKLGKINKKAQADLKKCKTKAQVDDVMERYRKQRNIAIGAGAAVAVTLGACLVFSRKKGKQNEADLNKRLSETQTQIKALEAENTKTAKALHDTDQLLQRSKLANATKREKLDEAEKTISQLRIQNKDLKDINKNLYDRANAATGENRRLKLDQHIMKNLKSENLELNKLNDDLYFENQYLKSEKETLEHQLAIARASTELLSDASKDAVAQSSEFARNCMKLGAQMQRTSDARKAVYKTKNVLEEARAAGDDKAVDNLTKSLSNAKQKANYSASRVLDKRDAVLVSENKEYKRLGRMIEDTKRVLKSGKDAAGNPIDVEDVQNDLNRLISKQRSILYDAREKYREAHKNVKFVR